MARATDIARSMVKEYGMSAKVGQVYFARGKRAQFLNIPMEGAVEYSEATAELIDGEVKDIVNQQYARALEILQQRRDVLNKGAEMLLGNWGQYLTLTIIPEHPGFLLAMLPPGAFFGLALLIAGRNAWQARSTSRSITALVPDTNES